MDRDEFMELVYETFADEPDNVLANGIIEAADAYVEHEKAQLSKEGTTSDLIDRQAARHALCKAVHNGEDVPCENQTASCLWTGTRVCDFVREIDALPTVQPEPSIPLSWIEKYIEWLKSLDNEFANLESAHISVMVKKWRDEQDETD